MSSVSVEMVLQINYNDNGDRQILRLEVYNTFTMTEMLEKTQRWEIKNKQKYITGHFLHDMQNKSDFVVWSCSIMQFFVDLITSLINKTRYKIRKTFNCSGNISCSVHFWARPKPNKSI